MNIKLNNLRDAMLKNGIDVYLMFSTDYHLSEYVPEDFMQIKHLTGFSGDNAVVVVSQEDAVLFTDSRYEISSKVELLNSDFQLCISDKLRKKDYLNYLKSFKPFSVLAYDSRHISLSSALNIKRKLDDLKFIIKDKTDLIASFWPHRPAPVLGKTFALDEIFTGQSAELKIADAVNYLNRKNVDALIVTQLDEIAWLLNIRGGDIACNPVFRAFLIVFASGKLSLFVHLHRPDIEVFESLKHSGISICDYDGFFDYLSDLPSAIKVEFDFSKTCAAVKSFLNPDCIIVDSNSVISQTKTCKNQVELNNIRQTMIVDGVALEKFFYRLEKSVSEKRFITETAAAKLLLELRREGKNFIGESFDCISAYNAHGAMPHFVCDVKNDLLIKPDGVYLVDSGGQYLSGTTDITRVIPFGNFSEQFAADYTAVLKGMINFSLAVFPDDLPAEKLDTYAREYLWKIGRDFAHSVSHGVGFCLNVHEYPAGIYNNSKNPLLAGMVISNEPAVYVENSYGIRIENMIAAGRAEFNNYLKFETLTLCHIDMRAVITDLLTKNEIDFLNRYHSKVYQEISPYLNDEEKQWLLQKTQKI